MDGYRYGMGLEISERSSANLKNERERFQKQLVLGLDRNIFLFYNACLVNMLLKTILSF